MKKALTLGAMAALAATAAPAEAQASGRSHYAGGLVGLAMPSGVDRVSSRFGWGLVLGTKAADRLGLGAYLMSSTGPIEGAGTMSFKVLMYGVEANALLDPGFSLGVRIGPSSVGTTSGGGSLTGSPLAVGPRVGYDASLGDGFAAGFDFSAMFVQEGKTQLFGFETKTNDAFTLLSLMASLKYRF